MLSTEKEMGLIMWLLLLIGLSQRGSFTTTEEAESSSEEGDSDVAAAAVALYAVEAGDGIGVSSSTPSTQICTKVEIF